LSIVASPCMFGSFKRIGLVSMEFIRDNGQVLASTSGGPFLLPAWALIARR
jgi:hypothetical protein